MTTKLYMDGKRITKKALKEQLGKEQTEKILTEAKEPFFEDPLIQNQYFVGSGMPTIKLS